MYPQGYRYSKDHEWISVEGDRGRVGVTDYAQKQLGDVVFVELPAVGKKVDAGKPFGVVEAVKTVSDLYAPISGEVAEVNDALAGNPALVNQEPYGEGWMIRLKPRDPAEFAKLLSNQDYGKLIEEQHA